MNIILIIVQGLSRSLPPLEFSYYYPLNTLDQPSKCGLLSPNQAKKVLYFLSLIATIEGSYSRENKALARHLAPPQSLLHTLSTFGHRHSVNLILTNPTGIIFQKTLSSLFKCFSRTLEAKTTFRFIVKNLHCSGLCLNDTIYYNIFCYCVKPFFHKSKNNYKLQSRKKIIFVLII